MVIANVVEGEPIETAWGNDVADAINALQASGVGLIPTGAIVPFGGSAAPSGWLLCDGTSYLRATYPDLFAVVGTTFGAVDGTHFTVPDLRGRFPLGKATAGTGSTLGGVGGSIDHTHTGAAHTHTGPSHAHTSAGHTHTGAGHTHTGPSHQHDVPIYFPTSLRMGMAAPFGTSASTITGQVRTADMTDDTASTSRLPALSSSAGNGASGSTTPGAGGSTTPADTGSAGTGASGSTTPGAGGGSNPPYQAVAYIIRT